MADATAAAATDLPRYYALRAAEYERIYAKPERQEDLAALRAWLAPRFAGRRVLEIACGTGWWTAIAAPASARWVATDLNDEMLAIARTKPLPSGRVRFERADAYRLDAVAPGERFDAAFAGFWWSHVPQARLRGWLAGLHARLQQGALVVLLDNRFVAGSSTPLARTDADGDTWQIRRLADGSTHEVLKNFPEPAQALAALPRDVRDARWIEFGHYWILAYHL